MASLVLSFLGPFQATKDENSVSGFESNKVRALLVYVALNSDQPHSREKLAGFLWPDRPEPVARGNLRQALANLRQTLGDGAAATPYLLINRESVQFNREANVSLDVEAFTSLVAAAGRHLHRREEACQRCAGWLQEAASIYRGNFLEHFSVNDSSIFEEWVLITRERLHHLATKALMRLAVYHERRGEYERSLVFARKMLELDPWREEAHCQIVRVLALSGQRSAALAQYEACRRLLDDELGVEPSEEIQSLYKQIKAGANPLSVACRPSRIPVELTPFLGREEEVEAITGLIEGPSCRLVTLAGPGGIGKTRLALEVAQGQVGSFLDGVIFVPLAPVRSGDGLVAAIGEAVGLAFTGQQGPREQLLQYLHGKETLLVLDNFEHLLAGGDKKGATRFLADLLRAAPRASLLVTSRERLNLRAEHVFDLVGLPFPPGEDATDIERYSAIQLFLQQARQVERGFSLKGDAAKWVAQICRMVEGMPLAIEMAAAGVRTHPCQVIAQELARGLQALVTTMQDVPERHHSMRVVFDHSWRLLSPREQHCLQQLSVFRGGIRGEAAAQVAAADGELLSMLVDKSLLRVDQAQRYSLHELFRQYAGERLRHAGGVERARNDHLAWFLAFAEQAEPDLYTARQQMALERLESDHENLRAALEWAIDCRNAGAAARLGSALSRFWGLRGYLNEGRKWLDQVLALLAADQAQAIPAARARVLLGAGALAWRQGDFGPAIARMEESLAISQGLGDEAEIRRTLRVIATAESSRGNDDRAIALLQECLERDRRAGDRDGIAYDFGSLADSMYFQGDCEQAKSYYEESLAMHRERQDDYSIAICLNNLGEVARVLGDYQGSAAYIREAISFFRQLDIKQSLANAIMNLGELEAFLGEDELAQVQFCEALELQQALSAWGDVACILPDFAALALKAHEPERAACLYAVTGAMREAMKIATTPAQMAEYEANVGGLRRQLGKSAFKKAWEAGNALTLEQAIGYALRRDGQE